MSYLTKPPSIHSVVNEKGELTFAYPKDEVFCIVQRRAVPPLCSGREPKDYEVIHEFLRAEGRTLYSALLLWASEKFQSPQESCISLLSTTLQLEATRFVIVANEDTADFISLQCDEAIRIALILYKWI